MQIHHPKGGPPFAFRVHIIKERSLTSDENYATEAECQAYCDLGGCVEGVPRWFCEGGECTLQCTSLDEGYETLAECEANCDEEPTLYNRYVCDGEGNCILTSTTNPATGYETQAQCEESCAAYECLYTDHIEVTSSDGVHHQVWVQLGSIHPPTSVTLVKVSGEGTVEGLFPPGDSVNIFAVTVPPGGTLHLLATASSLFCPDAEQSCSIVSTLPPLGRYLCLSGDCVYYDSVAPPTGYATEAECLAACEASVDCSEKPPLTLTSALISGGTYRVTASRAASFSDAADDAIANETATTCLVEVGAGASFTVKAHASEDGCTFEEETVVEGAAGGDDGEADCTVALGLSVEDRGEGIYRFTANLSGVQGGSPTVHWVDGGAVAADAGFPWRYSATIAPGTTRTVVAAVVDGECAAGDSVTIVNSDNGGAFPPPVVSDDGCASVLGHYVRDISADWQDAGQEIYRARFGLEVHDGCVNQACRYVFQAFHSSDAALVGVYSEAALDAHFPLNLARGQFQEAQGLRQNRLQVAAGDLMRPATGHVHLRITADPAFELWPLETVGSPVKIRDHDGLSSFVFTSSPARVMRYVPPPEGAVGAARSGTVTAFKDLAALGADDATDATIAGDKIYVARPGEVFALDTDAGQNTYNSGIRGETGTVFLETVGSKAIVLYVDSQTRAYDLTFPSGTPLWTLAASVTQTGVADGKLLLAADSVLYSSEGGSAAPVLQHTFPTAIKALAGDYVGLLDGHIWRNLSSGWTDSETLGGPVGALWPWLGGEEEMRALAGAASGGEANKLRAEQPTMNWTGDRVLTGATGVRAMHSLSIEVKAMSETEPAVVDERMLIGDDVGTLWVYSRRPVPPGAVVGCHIALPRIVPISRVKSEE